MHNTNLRNEQVWLVVGSLMILATVALAIALIYTRGVMIPFVLAIFITTIVSPVVDFEVTRLRFPRPLAIFVALLLALAILVLLGAVLMVAVQTIVREYLLNGYKWLMWKLYEPNTYYRRVLTFLKEYRPNGPKLKLTAGDIRAFLRSMWVMGVVHRGRVAFWRYLAIVLLRHPRKLPPAIALAIHGFHYRMVAKQL